MFFIERFQRKTRENPQGGMTAIGHRAGPAARHLPDPRSKAPDPGFPLIDGPHYYDVLAALHEILSPEWYFEIGTNRGGSLNVCPGKFVAIDPEFIFRNFAMGPRVEGHFFQLTSDDFFAQDFLGRTGIRPELGFLDGMHLFEFLLRDFIAFERRAAPGAMAILHDCLPFDRAMTEREWDGRKTRLWTGDVWKTLQILMRHRPDLQFDMLDAWPTGLVLVRGLDPENSVLPEVYDAVVAEFMATDIGRFGPEAYYGQFDIQSSYSAIEAMRTKGGAGPTAIQTET